MTPETDVFSLFIRAALIGVLLLVTPTGSSRGMAADPEHTAPQGEDPPGTDEGGAQIPAPSEHEGVIPPPAVGDEDIQTEEPNPNAGTEQEVIPPSELPEQQPGSEHP
jgi:hypothetical protein